MINFKFLYSSKFMNHINYAKTIEMGIIELRRIINELFMGKFNGLDWIVFIHQCIKKK